MIEPITKKERYLAYLAGDKTVTLPQPVTREERYLAAMCGMDVELPQAVTRVDRLMDKIVTQSTTSLQPLKSVLIVENGTKNVTPDDGYDGMQNVQIDVAVPDSVHVHDFQVDQNGNYITDALNNFTSVKELASMLLNALSDVFITLDFDINKGDFVSIIGSNGAGKSTILKLILGEVNQYRGEIKLYGEDIKRFKNWQHIGYLEQNAYYKILNFPATVYEIVMSNMFSDIGLFKFPNKKHKEKV